MANFSTDPVSLEKMAFLNMAGFAEYPDEIICAIQILPSNPFLSFHQQLTLLKKWLCTFRGTKQACVGWLSSGLEPWSKSRSGLKVGKGTGAPLL